MLFFSAAVTFYIEKFAILTNVRASAFITGECAFRLDFMSFRVALCVRCRDLFLDEDLQRKKSLIFFIHGCDACLSKLVGSALDDAIFLTSSAVLRMNSNVCAISYASVNVTGFFAIISSHISRDWRPCSICSMQHSIQEDSIMAVNRTLTEMQSKIRNRFALVLSNMAEFDVFHIFILYAIKIVNECLFNVIF